MRRIIYAVLGLLLASLSFAANAEHVSRPMHLVRLTDNTWTMLSKSHALGTYQRCGDYLFVSTTAGTVSKREVGFVVGGGNTVKITTADLVNVMGWRSAPARAFENAPTRYNPRSYIISVPGSDYSVTEKCLRGKTAS